jgi:hypothetical protein
VKYSVDPTDPLSAITLACSVLFKLSVACASRVYFVSTMAAMLDFPDERRSEQKCEVTLGVMGHLDSQQPPVKRKPFSAILAHPFVRKVNTSALNSSNVLTC